MSTVYFGDHAVTFGIGTRNDSTGMYNITDKYSTWTKDGIRSDHVLYLIPSAPPFIVPKPAYTNYVDIPGGGALDLSEVLTNGPLFNDREGQLTFVADIDRIANTTQLFANYRGVENLHNKVGWLMLEDDPGTYYVGRFTVSQYQRTASYPTVQIGYRFRPDTVSVEPSVIDPVTFEVGGQSQGGGT